MTPASLIKLVDSLSKSEKRHFKLRSKTQSGNKEYLLLFDLIERQKNPQVEQVKKEFKKQSPAGSWDNTCSYLAKMLTDCLVRAKKDKDIFFSFLHEIKEIKILQQRSLDDEAFRQVKKLQQKALKYQLHWIEYYCYRYELNYYSDNNFTGVSDEQLVKTQMKAKDVLKSLNHIQDHYSLYELLKYRLIHSGKVVSEDGKKKLNDLMLSEMVLVAGKSKSFTSQKLHLLFQSFFFTDIGDYRSALKSFYQLNELLEKNEPFLDNPPLDYLSALIGIIDSLRMLHNNTETGYYLQKLNNLDQPCFPEYFRYLVKKIFYAQHILTLLELDQTTEARTIVNSIPAEIFDSYIMIDEEKQCELYFYCSLTCFHQGDLRKAHLFIREIMNQVKLPAQLLVSKAIRLLNIIIYFEKEELPHLEYEIRSYKRYFTSSKLSRAEKLAFRIIASSAANKRLKLPDSERKKIFTEAEKIKTDRYEQQLLKYFDFTEWIRSMLERKTSLPELRSVV